ncbi:MAG: serine/threonine protein kinase [Planctomycetes bacterium]|nr:serine/threonine protein kinase [Planctomycetota bacterium]
MAKSAHDSDDLPPALADAAAERLLAARAADRERVLTELIAGNPGHAAALQRFAQELAGAEAMLDATFAPVRGEAPKQIGGYRVVRELGEGAFGIVYLCRQETPVVRDVAVKVLRPGAGDQQTLRRFAAERQLLATLNHPSITQVFDAGELPDGRPFFVMEHVDGVPIRAWSDANALACEARLRLFVQVCRGIAHAHSRGIVHRDLKPANVLVTDRGDGPLPKIIDFGIAKALHATETGAVQHTAAGRVVGTPGYMSPEQAAGRAAEVDARADVFALGVMLYELLTGTLPWTDGAAATDTEPIRPSRRVTTSVAANPAPTAPTARQLVAQLRGDLDWITLKALARDPRDRYPSVAALIDDIDRHLTGRTVSAGPPSLRYRLRKWSRRHRAAVAIVSSAVVLAVGLGFAFAYGARKDANVEANLADVRGIVGRMLQRANDPALYGTAHGDAIRRALSDECLRIAEGLLAGAPDDPALQRDRCEALLQMAQMHWLLSEPVPARKVADEALRVARALASAAPDDNRLQALRGRALRQQGRAIVLAGDDDAAHVLLREALVDLRPAGERDPAGHGLVLAAALREAGGTCAARDPEQAIALLREAIGWYERLHAAAVPGSDDHVVDDLVAVRLQLVSICLTRDGLDEARALLDRSAAEMAGVEFDRHRLTGEFEEQRAVLAWHTGDRTAAIEHHEAALAAARAWCEAQPRRSMTHRVHMERWLQLARAKNGCGDFDGASAAFRQAIEIGERTVRDFPADAGAVLQLHDALCHYADVLRDRFRRRDLAEAAACVERAIALVAASPFPTDGRRLAPWRRLASLAGIEASRGEARSAELWRQVAACLPTFAEAPPTDHDELLAAYTGAIRMHFEAGECAAAAPLVKAALACLKASPRLQKRQVEVDWWAANCAAAAGEVATVAALGERIAKMRPSWFGYRRAGDCHRLAWRTAGDAPNAVTYRDRAAEYYRQVDKALSPEVAKDPSDPWQVLPWGFCRLHLATIAAATGDTAAARSLLAATLPVLAAVRDEAQCDEWDEPSYRAAVQLQAGL